ncbi:MULTISPECIES: DUF4148 domain-containing protein [Burkholderia]|uniref:DUF4148 domain-containing protein n=2 Tax=Burkholderia humptydooensis TaxID=430531 RepID=A0A7U4P8D8_9BURK|nr:MULTISPECIES: DUF4148 domain-containing protein [Burkholderia]AJY38865.1 hypothetical protein BW21_4172 [Burkholderia sp. 2002721687]ALX44842.1 hypothetical protein AQ610_20060 [Burkholderia humptydooensis]KVN06729.1 hypothetical protein WT08_19810 [Burkholderia sp. MSMB1552]KWZ50048.1 hypothetical protein WS92_21575 [Burkholderia sp. MSMB1588]QPS46291.1 DUF4148 domain-containing protein [Burkholderia humptydooensis]
MNKTTIRLAIASVLFGASVAAHGQAAGQPLTREQVRQDRARSARRRSSTARPTRIIDLGAHIACAPRVTSAPPTLQR